MRYALHFLVVLLAALLSAAVFSAPTHAADAVWESGKIVYDEKSYLRAGPVSPALSNHTGIPEGSEHFVNIDETEIPPVHRIIYFSPGTELADATGGRHTMFQVTDKGTAGEEYDRIGSQQDISLDQASYEAEGEAEVTSCVVTGIGYIICPIMNLMAEGMDKLFNVFKSLLHVAPLFANTDNGLYRAWSIALAIANVLFVVGFLAVIYSYVTSRGVSQYDIRTILPRVVVAAILINASYHLAALAVDISNILGANLQDIFNDLRGQLVSSDETVTDPNTWSWNSVTTYVLSGGTLAAGIAGIATLGAYGSSALYLLMPMLVAAIIAILVVIVVLAARHALITVLVVLAPIAFAAFILPSTQKYFDRWRSIFMTMLLMYPMFSLLFGGSQLAAQLIAQNATGVTTLLFAMFIQVAPLVITPFLIQFSGKLLGRIAGIVNNPTKGLGDRVKNLSKGKADMAKNRRIAEGAKGAALARRFAQNKMHEENLKKRYDTKSRERYNASARGRQDAIQQMIADQESQRTENLNQSAAHEAMLKDPRLRQISVEARVSDINLDVAKNKLDTYFKEISSKEGAKMYAGGGDRVEAMLGRAAAAGDRVASSPLVSRLHELSEEKMVQASRQNIADSTHRAEYATDMVGPKGDALQARAGGIAGEAGKMLAAASATQTLREDFGKQVSASTELLRHFGKDLDNDHLKKLAYSQGKVTGRDSSGREYTFDTSAIGSAMHEAAATKFMQETNAEGFEKFMMHVSTQQIAQGGQAWTSLNTTVKDIAAKQFISKLPYAGGKSLDFIDQGLAMDAASAPKGYGIAKMITQTIEGGKLGPEKLVGADPYALKQIIEVIEGYNSKDKNIMKQVNNGKVFAAEVSRVIEGAKEAFKNDNLKGSITSSAAEQLTKLSKM